MTPRLPKRFEAKVALPPRVPAPLAIRRLLPGTAAQMKPAPARTAVPPVYRPPPSNPALPAARGRTPPVAQAKRPVIQRATTAVTDSSVPLTPLVQTLTPTPTPYPPSMSTSTTTTTTTTTLVPSTQVSEAKFETCLLCRDDILQTEAVVRGHCQTVVYHATCLSPLKPAQRSQCLFKESVQGRSVMCVENRCQVSVDPGRWRDVLGAEEVTRLTKTAAPPKKEKWNVIADLPLGTFQCPSCGKPFLWDGGCDVMSAHAEEEAMVQFHIVDQTHNHPTARNARLVHSNLMNSLATDIDREQKRARNAQAGYQALLGLKKSNVMAWKALGLDQRLQRIGTAVKARQQTAAIEAIGETYGVAFKPLDTILRNYITASTQGSCCVIL